MVANGLIKLVTCLTYSNFIISLLCFPLNFLLNKLFLLLLRVNTNYWKVIILVICRMILLVLKVSIVLISSSPTVPSCFCRLSLHCHPLPALNDESAVLPTERPVSLHADSAFLHG